MALTIVAAQGSVRPGNFTGKALALVIDEIRTRPGYEVDHVDPAALHLPPAGVDPDAPDAVRLRERFSGATGVILATPEYHGSFSGILKNLIENLGFPSVLSGKPVALLGVAAGAIGAIKSLEHLRSVCSHVGALVLPGSVSVAGVRKVFDAQGRCTEEAVERRLRGVAGTIIDYIEGHICPRVALEQMVRED